MGDLVTRRSYQADMYFVVREIRGDIVILQGLFHRLQADAPIDDLIKVTLTNKSYFEK